MRDVEKQIWNVRFGEGGLTAPGGELRSPIWTETPDAAVAHDLLDRWEHDSNVGVQLPRIGRTSLWWIARPLLWHGLMSILPYIRLLNTFELPFRGKIILHQPPNIWIYSVFRRFNPSADIRIRGTSRGQFKLALKYLLLASIRSIVTTHRSRRVSLRSAGKGKVVLISRDRMWKSGYDWELGGTYDALSNKLGTDPIVLVSPFGSTSQLLEGLKTRPMSHMYLDFPFLTGLLKGRMRKTERKIRMPSGTFTFLGIDFTAVIVEFLEKRESA